MKLFVPVVGMIVATGFCCCGDSMDLSSPTVSTPEPSSTAPASDGRGLGPSLGGIAGGETCGKFKDAGMAVPGGLSVLACTVSGDQNSLVLTGSSDPKAACDAVKAWATGAGWSVQSQGDIMGTVGITLTKGSSSMSIGCTNATGSTTVSVAIQG